jgi:serine/threonine protein kinase/tetratricopeptide (TPR) repeat protein
MNDVPRRQSEAVEELLGQVADEYTQRLAAGENPDIEEYAGRHPEIAAVIRQVFPALRVMRPAAATPAAGRWSGEETRVEGCLGDYRILREIGRGGMGVVYEAEQISLGRRVALKVLPFAAVLDRRQLERFKREAQAAAQLHHTNIVPVFAVGCERGVHYYAMQYIDGRPLSVVIQELRQLSGLTPNDERQSTTPQSAVTSRLAEGTWAGGSSPAGSSAGAGLAGPPANGATTGTSGLGSATTAPAFFRAVAELGVQAAGALQHAHEQGVVHRDIKPANLLVDAEGHLWVTDFGLALMRSDSVLTMPGDVLGTLRYMSPEQTRGQRALVDQRTDVYSLGVTLYELLCLEPAFGARDRHELLRQIAGTEPRPLRKVRGAVPRELETIVTKALSKNPEQRYASAQRLADDLRRFLEDRPILAKPPTVVDRVGKWARRHRTVVSAAAALLVMAVVGLSVSMVLIARERSEAWRQRDLAVVQHAAAEENLQLARETVDRLLMQGASEELGDEVQLERVRQMLVDDSQAVRDLATLTGKLHADGDLQAQVGQAYQRVADINALLGQTQQAEAACTRAIAVFKQFCADYPETPACRQGLANSYLAAATLRWESGRPAEAEAPVRAALAALRELTATSSEPAVYGQELARGLNLLGLVLRDRGCLVEAEEALRESIGHRTQLAANAERSPRQRLELARCLRNLADVLLKAGRREDAAATVQLAQMIQEELVQEYPSELSYGAELAHTQRWWNEAQAAPCPGAPHAEAQRQLPAYQKLVAELPEVPWHREQLARAYWTLGHTLTKAGCPAEAAAARKQAVAFQEQLAGSFPNVPRYRERLVELYRLDMTALSGAWRLAEADETCRKAVEMQQALVAEFPDRTAYRVTLDELEATRRGILVNLPAAPLVRLDRESPQGVAEAVTLARATDLTQPLKPFALLVIGDHLILGGDYERAVTVLRQAVERGGNAPYYYKSLGWALLACGRKEEARAAFEKALEGVRVRTSAALLDMCFDPTTAAYFLDLLSEHEYTGRWKDIMFQGARYAPAPWFYVGCRRELEGRRTEARAAYQTSVALGRAPNAHHTANWAAYRLTRLDAEDTQHER